MILEKYSALYPKHDRGHFKGEQWISECVLLPAPTYTQDWALKRRKKGCTTSQNHNCKCHSIWDFMDLKRKLNPLRWHQDIKRAEELDI